MMKKYLNKYAIALISVSFAGIGFIIACAGGWWSINESTNYTPEIFVNKAYTPFFYQNDYFYYSINYDDRQNERFSDKVTDDWFGFFEKKYPRNDIKDLLFSTRATTIDSFIKKPDVIPSKFSGNVILASKEKKKNEFLNYLLLAKQAEVFALRNEDDWSYYGDKPKKQRSTSAGFCMSILNAYQACKNDFIKQRLFFQLVRAYYFNRDYSSCLNVYEGNYGNFPKNTMYYRTLSYAAGALKKKGEIAKANYFYSLVYNNEDELKTTAHFSFKPQDEKDWQQTLALCTSSEEKCNLWHMLGVFYKDEIRSIKEIIQLDPASEKLDLLIARAVNKMETNLFDADGFSEYKAYKDDKEAGSKLTELQKLLNEIIQKGNSGRLTQAYMALGYLQLLERNHAKAFENFALAKKASANNKAVLTQARLLELINTIAATPKIDAAAENKFLPELRWLDEVRKDSGLTFMRTNAMNEWIKKVMAKKYRAQNELLKAEFFVADRIYYTNEKQLHDMQNFLTRTDKTPFEKYCEEKYTLNLFDLYEFEAIDKAFKDDVDAAVVLMEKAGKNGETTLLSNPFNGGIKDCHDCDHAQAQKIKYTKLLTVKKMKEMKDKLSSDTYNNALLLANVYYSMTYFGSSRVFYDCSVFQTNSSATDKAGKTFINKLFDMALATKYYKMALAAAKTDEQKAKCVYMLSKCERNEWYNKGGNDKGIDFITWKNFSELKKYSATKYYKEVVQECGYFKKCIGY